MVGPSANAPSSKSNIKFLCSYGGKILPRYPDGKLRYLGGHTRVLPLPRSIPFSELMVKLGELCGSPVSHLRCQLPTEDLDALVSITSDEDLANLIEEYDHFASLKIRAFLSSLSKPSPSSSSSSLSSSSSSSSLICSPTGGGSGSGSGSGSDFGFGPSYTVVTPVVQRCVHQMSPPIGMMKKYAGSGRNIRFPYYAYHAHGNRGLIYLNHNANHWQ